MHKEQLFRYALYSVVGLSLGTLGACKKKSDDDSQTKAPYVEDEDDLPGGEGGGAGPAALSEAGLEVDEETISEEEDGRWSEPLSKLPDRPKVRKKCRGKGKRRKCKMVDPKPGIAASYGVREFMEPYRFGMPPAAVIRRLSKGINEEYETRMKGVEDAGQQDTHRRWRREQIDKIRSNHVKFDGQNHRWGASIVQHDFEDDANEEMIWQRVGDRKDFYFFKDGELWKVVRAFDTRAFPEKDFKKIVEDDWKKQFGVSPQEQKVKDKRSTDVLLNFLEWQSSENATIRAFDMSAVQGAYVLSVIDRGVEGRIGKRLPNVERSQGKLGNSVDDALKDVKGGSDVCYDDDGNMIESRARCKEIRGF